MIIECLKCHKSAALAKWRYLGPADSSGQLSYRICPECGYPKVFEEMTINEEYDGPMPWAISKFRGQVYKGTKKKHKEKSGGVEK